MCHLPGWMLVCSCISHKSVGVVRAPVTDPVTLRAPCHDSGWKSVHPMCGYTSKMV
jgi:hypothetical protein